MILQAQFHSFHVLDQSQNSVVVALRGVGKYFNFGVVLTWTNFQASPGSNSTSNWILCTSFALPKRFWLIPGHAPG